MMMAAPGGMGGYPMPGPSADVMHRMGGMSLGRQQQQQQGQQGQQQQQVCRVGEKLQGGLSKQCACCSKKHDSVR